MAISNWLPADQSFCHVPVATEYLATMRTSVLPDAREAAAVGFARLSYATRRFVSANLRLCAITGYTAKEFFALSLRDLVHPEDFEALSAQCDRLMAGEIREFTAERRWMRKDGREIWISAALSMGCGCDGAPAYVIDGIEDITERKKVEFALTASRERLLLIEAVTGAATWELDLEQDRLNCSEETLRLYGKSAPWESYREWLESVHPSERARVDAGIQSAIRDGSAVDIEYRVVRPDGTVPWFNSRCRVFRNNGGAPTRMLGVTLDITEHKEARDRVVRSEQRLRRMIERLPAGAIYVDSGALYFNRAAETLLGHSPEEMDAVAHVFADAEQEGILSDTAENPDGATSRIATVTRQDGSQRIIEFSGYADEDVQVWLLHDITAMRQTQKELEKAKELAESASRAKGEFLANMSHEIRTPMNGVIGMTDLLLTMPLGEEQREYVGVVKQSADALLTLINDILDFSKIEAGKLELNCIDFDLRKTVYDSLKPFAPRADEISVELLCTVAPEVPDFVLGDPIRLRQVLTNLVGNAIKFTPAGEIEVRVEVDSRETDGWVLHFSVKDTGIGVPVDKQQVIFESFSQADASTTRKYGGTGLGLSICSRLVGMMNGRLWLESEPGKGSTFQFTGRLGNGAIVERRPGVRNLGGLQGSRVLAVDDNATNRHILHEGLKRWGMLPETVPDVVTAMEALRKASTNAKPFALVITDCQMPDQDGFMLVEQIGRDVNLNQIPVVMLTSGHQKRGREHGLPPGLAALLTKPVASDDLLDTILRVCGERREPAEGSKQVKWTPLSRPEVGLRILLAEDNPINQRVGVALLQKLGHSVDVVANGKQAVEQVRTKSYDVILMDMEMPEMDGLEATAAIRAWEQAKGTRIPIVAMTAHALTGYREQCIAAGMDGYISKPVSLDQLTNQLQTIYPEAPRPSGL
jgi:two-component system sensor histidine kinase/response regulator